MNQILNDFLVFDNAQALETLRPMMNKQNIESIIQVALSNNVSLSKIVTIVQTILGQNGIAYLGFLAHNAADKLIRFKALSVLAQFYQEEIFTQSCYDRVIACRKVAFQTLVKNNFGDRVFLMQILSTFTEASLQEILLETDFRNYPEFLQYLHIHSKLQLGQMTDEQQLLILKQCPVEILPNLLHNNKEFIIPSTFQQLVSEFLDNIDNSLDSVVASQRVEIFRQFLTESNDSSNLLEQLQAGNFAHFNGEALTDDQVELLSKYYVKNFQQLPNNQHFIYIQQLLPLEIIKKLDFPENVTLSEFVDNADYFKALLRISIAVVTVVDVQNAEKILKVRNSLLKFSLTMLMQLFNQTKVLLPQELFQNLLQAIAVAQCTPSKEDFQFEKLEKWIDQLSRQLDIQNDTYLCQAVYKGQTATIALLVKVIADLLQLCLAFGYPTQNPCQLFLRNLARSFYFISESSKLKSFAFNDFFTISQVVLNKLSNLYPLQCGICCGQQLKLAKFYDLSNVFIQNQPDFVLGALTSLEAFYFGKGKAEKYVEDFISQAIQNLSNLELLGLFVVGQGGSAKLDAQIIKQIEDSNHVQKPRIVGYVKDKLKLEICGEGADYKPLTKEWNGRCKQVSDLLNSIYQDDE